MTRMNEPTAKSQTATTGTTSSATTARAPIVFSDREKLLIQLDAQHAVSSRPLRTRRF
jgi:hypothetical protein